MLHRLADERRVHATSPMLGVNRQIDPTQAVEGSAGSPQPPAQPRLKTDHRAIGLRDQQDGGPERSLPVLPAEEFPRIRALYVARPASECRLEQLKNVRLVLGLIGSDLESGFRSAKARRYVLDATPWAHHDNVPSLHAWPVAAPTPTI